MRPQVVGIIPARYASTRLPGKALRMIRGKPMIQRVYERCRHTDAIDALYVATDDERIAEVVRGFGGSAMMTSPITPAAPTAWPKRCDIAADIVVNIQGDQPFLDAGMIVEAVRPLLDDPPWRCQRLCIRSNGGPQRPERREGRDRSGRQCTVLFTFVDPVPAAAPPARRL